MLEHTLRPVHEDADHVVDRLLDEGRLHPVHELAENLGLSWSSQQIASRAKAGLEVVWDGRRLLTTEAAVRRWLRSSTERRLTEQECGDE